MSTTTLAVLGIAGALVTLGGVGLSQLAGTPHPASQATQQAQPTAQPPAQPAAQPPAQAPQTPAEQVDPYVLGFKMKTIDGEEKNLEDYKGSVVLMINVASKCGYTSQYAGLEKLYKDKKDKGLVILGFPANNFGNQEPASEAEIKKFCTAEYGVTFPMFAKISVKGDDQHALYKKLAAQPKPIGGDPRWNFTKFIVDRSGDVVARYESRTTPDDAEMNRLIDELLAKK